MVCDNLPIQDAFIPQIWNSYLKEYRRYVPGTMHFLEKKQVKVTLTQARYATLRKLKMHAHTKFGIPT